MMTSESVKGSPLSLRAVKLWEKIMDYHLHLPPHVSSLHIHGGYDKVAGPGRM